MNSIVVKLGGAAGVDAQSVLSDVAAIAASGQRLILVHGTSAAADALATKIGVPVRQIVSPSGHVSRYTDPEMLEIYVAAAAGQENKRIVAGLQALGCNALGLAGMDGRLLTGRRKDAVRSVENGRQRVVRDDYTGQLESVNDRLLVLLLDAGYLPVIAPLALGAASEPLNVDGDRAAALIAGAARSRALVILSNVPGLLSRFPDESSIVRHVPPAGLAAASDLAQGRMKKKILAAGEALAAGVPTVILADSRRRDPIRSALGGEGTHLGERTGDAQAPAPPAESAKATEAKPALAGDHTPTGSTGRAYAVPATAAISGGNGHAADGIVAAKPAAPSLTPRSSAIAPGHVADPASGARACPSIAVREAVHTSGVYPKRPLTIVRGEGARLWDDSGREYIDCVAGQGSANLGHAHPAIVAAITEQAGRLITCPEIFYNDRRAELLERLAAVAPDGLGRAFLCNSGAEAVESALKFARLATGRPGIVATNRGFHGRTMGALSATWNPDYRRPFEPLLPEVSHVPFNDTAALDEALGERVGALIIEALQGEGGVHVADADYLRSASRLCKERGAMLILDEVQTGFGRTGKMWASQHAGVIPDLMAVAKSMAGGLPMGACLIGPRVGSLPPMSHGSTFGGNPLSCAAAIAALRVMEQEKLPEQAAELGAWLMAELRALELPQVREVRGLGLMIGLDLRSRVTPVLQRLQSLGVLALPAGSTVLRLLPPLVIRRSELLRVVEAVAQAVTAPA